MSGSIAQFPFRMGLNEGDDPKGLPPGWLLVAENCMMDKAGRIVKRYGTANLTKSILGGGALSAGARLAARGSELCLIDGTNLYSYSASLAKWKSAGMVPNVGLTWSTSVDSPAGVSSHDLALSATGQLVQAWIAGDSSSNTSSLHVKITDNSGGAVIMAPSTLNSGTNYVGVRVLVIGASAFVIARTGNTLHAFTINLSTLAITGPSSLRTDMEATAVGWDACVIGSNLVIAYTNNAPQGKLYSYNASLVEQATQNAGSGTPLRWAIHGTSGESLYVLYSTSALTRISVHNPSTLALGSGPTTIEAVAGFSLGVTRIDSSNCGVLYVKVTGAAPFGHATRSFKVDNAATLAGVGERITWGVQPISRPFMFNSEFYYFATEDATVSAAVFAVADAVPSRYMFNNVLLRVKFDSAGTGWPHEYIGKIDNFTGEFKTDQVHQPAVVDVSSTEIRAAVLFQNKGAQSQTTISHGIRLVSLTLGASRPADTWRPVSVGQEVYLAAGVLTAYDGYAPFDYGWSRAPALETVDSAAGGAIAAGTYVWTAVHEYMSAAGMLHRSAVAIPVAETLGGATSSVMLHSLGASVSNKWAPNSGAFGATAPARRLAVFFRTVAAGQNLYRMTLDPQANVAWVDERNESQSWNDIKIDTNIDTLGLDLNVRPQVYTAGGILDDEQPPALVSLCYYRSRLFGIDGSRRQVWYSKSFQDDIGVAPGFSTDFRFVFESDLVGFCGLEDRLVIFGDDRIWALAGNGPTASGDGDDFGLPIGVQSDIGCTNPRSIVATPDGVMFQSRRGLEILDRGLNLTWIGRQIQDELAAYPNITSAAVVPDKHEVRFTCNNAAGTSGIVLAYDYVYRCWFTRKYKDVSDTANASVPIADAIVFDDVWTFVTPGGQVYQETTAHKKDAGSSFVTRDVQTAWISPGEKLAWHRVKALEILGTSVTDHDLEVSIAHDYASSWEQVKTFASTAGPTVIGPRQKVHVTCKVQKVQAVRFRLRDLTPSGGGSVGNGDGPIWEGFGLEVRVKRSMPRAAATEKG